MKKRPRRNYDKMVEEIIEIMDEQGNSREEAFRIVKRKYGLTKFEGEELMRNYEEFCELESEYWPDNGYEDDTEESYEDDLFDVD